MSRRQDDLAAVQAVYGQYARHLDDNALQAWFELFADECEYRVVPRENVDQGLPLALIDCSNRRMLADRIVSLKEANFFNVHYSRHILSSITLVPDADAGADIASEADYAAFQTDQEGVTRIFSVGRYRAWMRMEEGRLKIARMTVVADTYGIRTLLAIPI
jgi:anthranilate 1,2-dioxygenase small subunit